MRDEEEHPRQRQGQRKLKVMIITTPGSDREKYMKDLFSDPILSSHFEDPVFSPSVPSRSLRNRFEFFRISHEAGLLPELEWKAIQEAQESGRYETSPDKFFQCLRGIPVTTGRRGSQSDLKLHYSAEFWFKGKTINRGRSVLGCTLAHLIALKRFTTEGFDVLVEDNVRAPVETCAQNIWEAMEASHKLQGETGVECHFRFLGWLGSLTNLEYLLHTHGIKRRFPPLDPSSSHRRCLGVFPFPRREHLEEDLAEVGESEIQQQNDDGADEIQENEEAENDKSSGIKHSKPGGNMVWGSYAYWISRTAYERLLDTLQKDVGAMLWKGKRARFYTVKPIDKMLPRHIMESCGIASVQLTSHPAFFRAPMLTSKIHVKWDPEFCKSTEYQLESTGLQWSDLWLSDIEKDVIQHRMTTGQWLTTGQIIQMRQGNVQIDGVEPAAVS